MIILARNVIGGRYLEALKRIIKEPNTSVRLPAPSLAAAAVSHSRRYDACPIQVSETPLPLNS